MLSVTSVFGNVTRLVRFKTGRRARIERVHEKKMLEYHKERGFVQVTGDVSSMRRQGIQYDQVLTIKIFGQIRYAT